MEIPKTYLNKFTIPKKEEFEFQETGKQMQKDFKQNIWWLFHRFPLRKVQDAYKVCQSKGVYTIPFILGVINRLQ